MGDRHGTATAFIDATPETVFDYFTEHPTGLPRWHRRSRVEAIDRDALLFAYRSYRGDGNPAYVQWTWQVVAVDGGAQVTVRWDGHPKTFLRRVLSAPLLRRPQLSKEVPASLDAIHQHLSRRSVT